MNGEEPPENKYEKNFSAALVLVDFLKQNCQEVGIFRYPGLLHKRKKIKEMLNNADENKLKDFLCPGMEMEASAVLFSFIKELEKPLFPDRIQELILAENNVPGYIVAWDALGLLYQELNGKHLLLVTNILDLLYHLSRNSNRAELSTISLTVTLLPAFFKTQEQWTKHSQEVALIFHEMILHSQEWKERRPW